MAAVHPTNVSEVAWSSWLPAMGYALAKSKGPVMEIGVGHFSTPFLHEYCKASGRELWSTESDAEWRQDFDIKYGSDLHRFGYPVKGLAADLVTKKEFGVVFIDNSGDGITGAHRLEPFIGYRDKTEFVVVHDYHREVEASIAPFLKDMNYKIFNDYEPPTLLASYKHKL